MDDILETIENLPSSVYYGRAFSVQFCCRSALYLSGRREAGIFVGTVGADNFEPGLVQQTAASVA
jgi:hypothetical protein